MTPEQGFTILGLAIFLVYSVSKLFVRRENADISRSEAKVDELRAAVSKESLYVALVNDNMTRLAKVELKNADQEARLVKQDDRIRELEQKIDSITAEAERSKRELVSTQADLNMERTKVKSLETQVKTLEAQNARLTEENTQIRRELEEVKRELETYKTGNSPSPVPVSV